MTLIFEVLGGGTAEIVESDGVHTALHSSVPSPPGSMFAVTPLGSREPVRLKVRGCKRLPGEPPTFRIEGRFVDLTKEQRAAVTAPKGPPKA